MLAGRIIQQTGFAKIDTVNRQYKIEFYLEIFEITLEVGHPKLYFIIPSVAVEF